MEETSCSAEKASYYYRSKLLLLHGKQQQHILISRSKMPHVIASVLKGSTGLTGVLSGTGLSGVCVWDQAAAC